MKKFLTLWLFCLIIVPFIYSQGNGIDIWTTTTESIGRVYGMAVDESNPSTMYACGLDQGVWKTTNSGANWTQINNGLLNIQVQAIAVSKSNSQILYAGTNYGTNEGVYKSTDGGSSWTNMSNGIAEPAGGIGIQALIVHPNDANIAWCAVFSGVADAVNGLYKTTDGGANWFPIVNGIGAIKNFLCFAMSPTDPNTIYAGSSFSVATSTGPSAIYKSTDGGANWVLSSNGLPTDPTEINPVRTLNVSSSNANVVTAGLFVNTVTLLGGFYISTDAGASWVQKNNGLPIVQGKLIRSAAIRPGFDNQFYLGLDGTSPIGVYGTTDGGDNWFDFNGGTLLNTYTIRALVFNPTGNHTLFAGYASTTAGVGGVYEYTFSFVPVELVSFSAEVFSNNVTLSWITATEINNSGFAIERRNAGNEQWNNIGFVNGNGNSTEIRYYSFTDNSVSVGEYFYRLKQLDYNGNFTYSKEVEITILPVSEYTLKQNYPNPFNPSTKIAFSIPSSSFVSLKVFDILGDEINTLVNRELTQGSYEVQFNGTDLPSGVYFYNLTAGDFSKTMKMNLLK
ncbi:MAG: T9SS type A sorting domain-containing protein [Ignavibacteriaceae bacterium]|nr:T9SS type A sorting domain-containing protein [Ignavibacteriaceae bacterium]